jgi:acetyl/propionyl-CoA carboxylase alpha subunit
MYQIATGEKTFSVEPDSSGKEGQINGAPYVIDKLQISRRMWHVIKDNKSYTIINEGVEEGGRLIRLKVNGCSVALTVKDNMDLLMEQMGLGAVSGRKFNELKAPMPGLVLRSLVQAGDIVKKGDTLLVLEAMKMENTIKSPGDGEVSAILVKSGQAVEKGEVLITFR